MSRFLKTKTAMAGMLLCCFSLLAFGLINVMGKKFAVLNVSPTGPVDRPITEISVRFSKPLIGLRAPSEMDNLPLAKFLNIEPPLKGKLRYKTVDSLSFLIDRSSLKPNTRYRVTVKQGIRSLKGDVLQEPYVFSFENERFLVLGTSLSENDKHVTLRPRIYVYFTQPVNPLDLSRYIYLQKGFTRIPVRLKRLPRKRKLRLPLRARFVPWRVANRLFHRNKGARYDYRLLVPRLEKDTAYTLVIGSGLKARRGTLSLRNPRSLSFRTYGPLVLEYPTKGAAAIRPKESFTFRFSNSLAATRKQLRGMIKAEDVKGKAVGINYLSYYEGSSRFSVSFAFDAQKRYIVTIKPGIQDKFGQTLRKPITVRVETGDYRPYLFIPYPNNALIESRGKITDLPVGFANLDSLQLEVRAYHSPDAFVGDNPDRTETLDLSERLKTRNKALRHYLNLKKYLNRGHGLLRITVRASHESTYRRNRKRKIENEYFFQFTDLSLTLKYSPRNIMLYATRLSDTSAVGGATVEAYTVSDDKYGPRLFRRRSNGKGVLLIKEQDGVFGRLYNPNTYQRQTAFFVRQGRDFCLLDNGWANKVHLYNTEVGYAGNSMPSFYAYLFTPKGLYKKNETVVIKGYVRGNQGGQLSAVAGRKYRVVCNSPAGKEVLSEEVTTSRFGSIRLSYKLPADPDLGRYTVKLSKLDQTSNNSYHTPRVYGSFQVEAYRPREFEIKTRIGQAKKRYQTGDSIPLQVKGTYYHGGLMANAALSYRVDAYAHIFSPSHHELGKYSFGANNWLASAQDTKIKEKGDHATILYLKKAKLNEDGIFRSQVEAKVPFFCSARYELHAEVKDEKRQSVVDKDSTIVHQGDFYIGYRMKDYFISTGQNLVLQLLAVTPREQVQPSVPVTLRVYRITWNNVRKLAADGTYRWSSERKFKLVSTQQVTTGTGVSSPAVQRLRVKKPGTYVITLEAKDARGNRITNLARFYAWGGGYSPWQMNDDQTIDLIKDQKEYRVGDTAKIMVKSPYRKIDALVTVEREGVMRVFRHTLKGSADIIRVPIQADYTPNVFVSVILLQGRLKQRFPVNKLKDIYKPTVKIGYTVLNVKKDHKRLRIAVKANKLRCRPGERINLRLKVQDKGGRGVSSELSVYVVDEGVLSLIGYATPNPFGAFYNRRQLLVKSFDSRLRVLGQHRYTLKGENPGGEKGGEGDDRSSHGLSNIGLRRIFKAIAFSRSDIITDGAGNARVSFTMPDNLTKYRIMVIAADRGDRFGSTQKSLVVTKELIAKPALPRFLNLGDNISAGVVLDNNSGFSGQATVRVKAEGVKLLGTATKTVRIGTRGSQEVRFRFRAHKRGEAVFRFYALLKTRGGNFQDGLRWEIPVNTPMLAVASAKSDHLDRGGRDEQVRFPKDAFPGSAALEFASSSTALINLKGSVEYLFNYPYACLEQKMARVLPMLLAGDLVEAFGLTVKVDYRKLVQKYLDELYKYQDKSVGGFHYWPESQYQYKVSPYLSAHVLYVLWMAGQKGYSVDSEVFRNAAKYVKNYLARKDVVLSGYPYDRGYWTGTDVLSLYVLAAMGQAEHSYVDSVYKRASDQPVYSKAVLAEALYMMDKDRYRSLYMDLIATIARGLKYEAAYAYVEENGGDYPYYRYFYLSNVKSTAAVLNMLMRIDKKNNLVGKLTTGIMRSMRAGRWRTTQENMYVFWALSRYFNTYEKEVPDFVVRLKAQTKTMLREQFRGRSLKLRRTRLKRSSFPGSSRDKTLRVEKSGQGRLYYTLRLRYAPKQLTAAENRGFAVRKEIYDAQGNRRIQGSRFQAGQVYQIRLRVRTEADRYDVVVDDPLPAGFEAINPRLKRATLDAKVKEKTGSSGGWWTGFNRVAMKDDRVCLFARSLRAGTHTYTYFVKATTYGSFRMHPTKAEEMYYPEVYGLSAARRVSVR